MRKTGQQLLDLIAQTVFDKKGFNILTLDVRGVSTMTDYFVIAEGSVDRHVKAVASGIVHALQEVGENPLYVEGTHASDWVVIDYGNIVVHLLTPELREKYALESLWKEGKIVDVNISTEKPKGKL